VELDKENVELDVSTLKNDMKSKEEAEEDAETKNSKFDDTEKNKQIAEQNTRR